MCRRGDAAGPGLGPVGALCCLPGCSAGIAAGFSSALRCARLPQVWPPSRLQPGVLTLWGSGPSAGTVTRLFLKARFFFTKCSNLLFQ